jgi:signal transduction histidine kinase/BarA-like signal transduction histidine kinase
MSVSSNENMITVLIADDEATTRVMMKAVLEDHGFRVLVSSDGQEALDIFTAEQPDGIILDLEMPRLGGIAVCQKIRLMPNFEFFPIMISTVKDNLASIDEAFAAGATDFIAKPYNWALLARRMSYILKASQAMASMTSASELKNNFIQTISHELRTPLSGVLGLVELLKSTDLSAEQSEYCNAVTQSGETLQEIIGETLDFYKLEAGSIKYEQRTFSLDAVLQESCDIFIHRALMGGVILKATIASGCPTEVFGDSLRLKQILGNLLSNALKFTKTGWISVEVSQTLAGCIRFLVEDTGIGISASAQSTIFEPFVQADGSTTRDYGGTGLGLAIANTMAADLGGRLELVRSQPGEGSQFKLELPLVTITGSEPLWFQDRISVCCAINEVQKKAELLAMIGELVTTVVQVAEKDCATTPPDLMFFTDLMQVSHLPAGQQTHFFQLRDDLTPVSLESHPALMGQKYTNIRGPLLRHRLRQSLVEGAVRVQVKSNHLEGHKLSVLVAEDNSTNQFIVRTMLTKMGVECVVVADGGSAVEMAKNHDWDLILMDCAMPVMDGFEATRLVREHELTNGKHTTIVALTANAMADDITRCLEAGMDEHLSKPCSQTKLYQLITKYLSDVAQ